MVKETIVVFDPSDIRRIRLVCRKCQGEFSRPIPQGEYKLPSKCPTKCPNPNCKEEWWDDRYGPEGRIKAAVNLLHSINKLAQPVKEGPPLRFDIRLEMDE